MSRHVSDEVDCQQAALREQDSNIAPKYKTVALHTSTLLFFFIVNSQRVAVCFGRVFCVCSYCSTTGKGGVGSC